MAVHDDGDDRYIAFNRVDKCVRKPACPAFAMVFGNFGPRQRMMQNAGDGALDFVQEFQTQTGNGAVVVFGGLGKFAFGGGKETVGHWARRLRSSWIAPDPSTASILPAWYSA